MFDIPWEEELRMLCELNRRTNNHPMESSYCDEGEPVTCPYCHQGKIRTYCEVKKIHGDPESYCMTHTCDTCGREIKTSSLWCDVQWKRPFEQSDAAPTPLGDFRAECRGRFLPLRYRTEVCDPVDGLNNADTHYIDVDISGCHVGDEVSVGLEPGLIVPYDSDEREVINVADDGKFIMVISGFDPELYPGDTGYFVELTKSYYPYNINYGDRRGGRGFEYLIERDPKLYDLDNHYDARFISFNAYWMPRPAGFDINDPETQRWL